MVLLCLAIAGGPLLSSRSGGGGKLPLFVQVDETGVAHARINTAAYPFIDEAVRIRSVESDPAIELLTPRAELAAAFRKDSFDVELDLRFRVRDCRLLPLSGDPMVTIHLGDRWRSAWTFGFVLDGVGAAAPETEFVGPGGRGPGSGPGRPRGPGSDVSSTESSVLSEGEIATLCRRS